MATNIISTYNFTKILNIPLNSMIFLHLRDVLEIFLMECKEAICLKMFSRISVGWNSILIFVKKIKTKRVLVCERMLVIDWLCCTNQLPRVPFESHWGGPINQALIKKFEKLIKNRMKLINENVGKDLFLILSNDTCIKKFLRLIHTLRSSSHKQTLVSTSTILNLGQSLDEKNLLLCSFMPQV